MLMTTITTMLMIIQILMMDINMEMIKIKKLTEEKRNSRKL
jgi:hypothetical protein